MNKLIDINVAIDAICNEWCGVSHKDCKHPFNPETDDYYWCDGCETVLDTLPNLPSAPLYTLDELQTMQDLEWSQMEKMYELGNAEALQRTQMSLTEPQEEPNAEWRKKHYEMAYNQGYVDACKYYENLPEHKKGKWIWQTENRYVCSECGHHTQVDELFEEPMYAFCPYCSASMLDEDGNVRYER